MSAPFDPYHQWLGIPPAEQPPDHYRLLGLAHFADDPEAIEAAAEERMATLRTYQTGPRGKHTQQLLNEISRAKVCLLNPQTKATYDAALSGRLAARRTPPTATPTWDRPVPPPPPGSSGPTAALVAPGQPPEAPPVPPPPPEPAPISVDTHAAPASRSRRVAGDEGTRFLWLAGFALLLLGGIVLVGAAIYRNLSSGSDPPVVVQPPPKPAARRGPDRQPKPNPAGDAVRERGGDLLLSAGRATLGSGQQRATLAGETAVGGWSPDGEPLRWTVWLEEPGFFEIELRYAVAGEQGPRVQLSSGRSRRSTTLRGTAGQLVSENVGQLALRASGESEVALRVLSGKGDPLQVVSLRLTRTSR